MEEELRISLRDGEWPCTYTDHDRQIVRAIVTDGADRFWFVRASRDDDFGRATLIETSGGGVEPGEDPDAAIRRELKEELGAEVEILCRLGVVSDYYNLIHRHNINRYYLCRALSFSERHLTRDEIEEFHLSPLHLTYEEAAAEYAARACTPLGRLIARRELPILRRAREVLAGQDTLDCVSVENMRLSDALTIRAMVPGRTLMYRAALGVFRAADWAGETAIAVGGGNNGGDGWALACILAGRGFRCRIVQLSDRLSGDGAFFAARAAALGVPAAPYAPGAFSGCDTVADCLLGTGFQGSLREPWLSAVREINACGARVVSVDINSGMTGDTGEAETAVRSDLTVTVGFVKRGQVTENAGRWVKRLVIADIGIVPARGEYRIRRPGAPEATGDLPCPPWLVWDPVDVRFEEE